MAPLSGIGMLAVIENGAPRLRPLEFITVDGELWAFSDTDFDRCDGQHVEVLFFAGGYDLAQVHGVLRCSHHDADRQRLQLLQHRDARRQAVILKIVPQATEFLSATHPIPPVA